MTIDELEKFYKKVRDNENEIKDRQPFIDALSRELYDLNIACEKKDVRELLDNKSNKLIKLEQELNKIRVSNEMFAFKITACYDARIRFNKEYKNTIFRAIEMVVNKYFDRNFLIIKDDNNYYLVEDKEAIKLPFNEVQEEFVEYNIANTREKPWDLFVMMDETVDPNIRDVISDFLVYLFWEKYKHQVLYMNLSEIMEVVNRFLREKLNKTSLQRERNLLK